MKKTDDGTVFLGSSKAIQTQFGAIVKLGFNREDLEYMLENLNAGGWINTEIKQTKEGKPYCVVDNFKPAAGASAPAAAEAEEEDPFS